MRGTIIALEGQFGFTTEEMLHIAKEAEKATAAKSSCKQVQKRGIQNMLEEEEEEDETLGNGRSSLEL